jgi:2-polyprenyl-3-methyl-5-hydroxy-6-metoxy-1,4-benzoquinol methylase
LSRSAGIVWPQIRQLALDVPQGQPVKVLDIACGGGDVAWEIAGRALRENLPVQVEGCDINPLAVEYSTKASAAAENLSVRFFQLNVLKNDLPPGYDVLMCSLFLHHLQNDEARELLSRMAHAARRLVLVNDLRRTRLGYALAYLGCHLLSRSPIVHHDGPRSVRAAFTSEEIRALSLEAGLEGATITHHWPERYLLSWRKPNDGTRNDNS